MAKLIISRNGKVITDVALDKERTSIGRRPDNDIILEGDPAVSGRHAAVLKFGTEAFLEDQNSTNGTLVNGNAVTKYPLSNGDVIGIGHHELRYEAVLASDDEFEKTMVLSPADLAKAGLGSMGGDKPAEAPGPSATPKAAPSGPTPSAPPRPEAPPAAASAPAAAPTSTPPAPSSAPAPAPAAPGAPNTPPAGAKRLPVGKVTVSSGPNTGRSLKLVKALTTLGKPGVQVAAITRRGDGYYAVHVGPPTAPNRPKLNGDMLDNKPRKLSSGDSLEVAGTQMRFSLD